jgi:cytochrome d ubiquinol oxidase subunit I
MPWDRLQFGFTATFHYLFPQLTMGLALIIVILKWRHLRTGEERWGRAARFWARIFGVSFAMGVVTGIPLEFQFGTNWAAFSAYAGGVIGQTLAMEGVFAFFLESTFLGLFLYAEGKLSRRAHFATAVALFLGSWMSGYFIVATNAFMQHPVGYAVDSAGALQVSALATFLLNPWALWQYAHTMTAAVVTAAFVVAAVGAYWHLSGHHLEDARLFLRVGVTCGLIASVLQIMPTGDQHGKLVARYQPVGLAAMEGLFEGQPDAPLAIIGQPNVEVGRLENPVIMPRLLSFLAYGSFGSTVRGLNDFPRDSWPENIALLYYSYHIMVGLGTLLLGLMALSALLLWRDRLFGTPAVLWALMLAFPFPYIATTAGWLTTELGRQPWIVYGLMRTHAGASPAINQGNVVFSTLGFMGLYLVVGLLFLYLVARELARGPLPATGGDT